MCLKIIAYGFQKSKLKLFTIICVLFTCYLLIIQNSIYYEKFQWNFLLTTNLRANIFFGHKIGTKIVKFDPNRTSIIYFHLPSLNDYKIEDDYFILNKTFADKMTSSSTKSCLRRGTLATRKNLFGLQSCDCKENYFGDDCSIPKIINDVLQQNPELKIIKLKKPRRILLSLIWLNFQQNSTIYRNKLKNFHDKLEELSPLIDLFIINEIIHENFTKNNNYSLQAQFDHGSFQKFKSFTLLNSIEVEESKFENNFRNIEWKLMQQTWKIFSTQITEYRSEDLLIFMSINQFPFNELLIHFKYHSGIQDIVHLNPVYEFEFKNQKLIADYIRNGTETNQVATMLKRIKNIVITFQYMATLCRFEFENYMLNYCQSNNDILIKHFHDNFWHFNHIYIGSNVQKATNVII